MAYSAASSKAGNYTLTQLPPGRYELYIKALGFKDYIHTNFPCNTRLTTALD